MVSKEFVQRIFAHCEKNDWDEFCRYLDLGVRWWINDDKDDDYTHTGIYNVASWKEKVGVPLWARLKDGVFGNLSIAQCVGIATQKRTSLQQYASLLLIEERGLMGLRRRFAWFFVFDEETGKVKEIREYMNTAHVTD
ncbi:hypothetical protein BT69DRAFT_1290514 [Atractiella rhizophila]|nr:hypothetical protein BT69DRAFT_1290514 [Atractiella rhizophila]